MQADLFTDEDLAALAAPLPQSGKVERSSLETAYRCIDYRAFADSIERPPPRLLSTALTCYN